MKKTLLASASLVWFVASAETFSWVNYQSTTEDWKSYGTWSNWAVGTSPTGGNPEQKIPGASDDLEYLADPKKDWNSHAWMDLDGADYTFRSLVDADVDYATRYYLLRNGSLACTGSFTNTCVRMTVADSGSFTLASTSAARFGRGTQCVTFTAASGGSLNLYGRIYIVALGIEVEEGGTLNLDPVCFLTDGGFNPNQKMERIVNRGTWNMPHGITLGGTGGGGKAVFHICQAAGTLNLGGSVNKASGWSEYEFIFEGGTINATDDAAFSSALQTVAMTNGANGTVSVASGKTLDLTAMTFSGTTSLEKTGPGTLKLANVPTSLLVSEGTLLPAANANLGSAIELAAGATLRLAVRGVSADAIGGVDDAMIVMDESLNDSDGVLFSSTNAALLAALAAKIQTTGSGKIAVNGSALVYERAHESTVFSWKHEGAGTWNKNYPLAETNANGQLFYDWYPFCAAASWAVGLNPSGTNPDGHYPAADDDIYVSASYYPIFGMDMGGQHRKVRNLERNLDASGRYPNQAGFRGFFVRNGALEFTGSFTNVRVIVKAKTGGRFILGETSSARLGNDGAQDFFVAEAGGEIDWYGTLTAHRLDMKVEEGGKFVLSPKYFAMDTTIAKQYLTNTLVSAGTLSFPKGFTFVKGGWNGILGTLFDIRQNGGTLELGGPIVCEQQMCIPVDLTISGETALDVTNQVSFTRLNKLAVADGSTLNVTVPRGSSIDLAPMSFGANTTVNKYGRGRILFGESKPSVYNRPDAQGMLLILR